MCYRTDLFEKAGLPTDREEVSALWPTWDDYIATGEQFQEGIGDDKVHFVDAATNMYNSILMQSGDYTYFDTDDNLVIEQQPGRQGRPGTSRSTWSTPGISAKLQSFSNEWNAGFKNGTFATVACPAWMTGYIEEQAGDGQRRQVGHRHPCPAAAATGAARSSRSRPSSEHQDLAIKLAYFLTSADGQLAAFETVGNLPSNPTLYEDPARQGQDERVLQRRARRPDLRGRRQQPRAGLPRRQEPAGARRGRERPAQRRERREVLRRGLGRRLSRTPRPRQADPTELGRGPGSPRRPGLRPLHRPTSLSARRGDRTAWTTPRPAVAPSRAQPRAAPPRQRRRLHLHLAVLHPLRDLRAVPDPVHLLGLAARLEPAGRPHAGSASTTTRELLGDDRTSGTPWSTRSGSSCSRPCRSC